MLNTVKFKLCDVRDYSTAKLCVELGVDFVGLHCIWEIKTERERTLREIARRIPTECPKVGVVLVTLSTEIESIRKMVRAIRPTHLQLHSDRWIADAIVYLRDKLRADGGEKVEIMSVVKVPADCRERITELAFVSDLVLLDRTHYSEGRQVRLVEAEIYQEAVRWLADMNKRCLVAGGLTPENVRHYIDIAKPWGVDVQSGVEIMDQRGIKDVKKLRAFLGEVKTYGHTKAKRKVRSRP